MHGFLAALFIGAAAGVVDVAPMLLRGSSARASLAAFVHWLALGLLIPYLRWGTPPWLVGLLAAELLALPILVIVSEEEPDAWPPIGAMSAILGALVGWAGSVCVRRCFAAVAPKGRPPASSRPQKTPARQQNRAANTRHQAHPPARGSARSATWPMGPSSSFVKPTG